MSSDGKEGQPDENKIDFEILRRHLQTPSPGETSSSTTLSTSSLPNSPSSLGNDQDDMIWPLQLTPRFMRHYVVGEIVGYGSYAEVRECVDMRNLERLAMKITDKSYLARQAPQALANQYQEIRLLRNFKHPHVISLRECIQTDTHIYIVLEYCPFNLDELLHDQPNCKFSISLGRQFFLQLCQAVDYLHSIGVAHRDIKPRNLLLTHCGCLKLIDFGVSHILSMWNQNDTCSNYEGTPLFQAPEIVAGGKTYRGFKADVWSCGVTLFLMLYGHYPFDDEGLLGLYDRILGEDLCIPNCEPTSLALTDLLVIMLDKDCSRRASIEQVLEHPWIRFLDNFDDVERCEYLEFFNLVTEKPDALRRPIDVYRSMTVLPYLYKHHFPNLPIRKSRSSGPLSCNITITKINPLESSATSKDLDHETPRIDGSKSSIPSPKANGGKQTIHDSDEQPIEWGTKEQYHLMKVPQIRVNRTRSEMTSSKSELTKKAHHRKCSKS